jgi:hypothetical protein
MVLMFETYLEQPANRAFRRPARRLRHVTRILLY